MLTLELLEQTIKSVEYKKLGVKTTVCCLTLNNGFEVIGTSAPVDPSKFDLEVGKKYAYEKAVNKLWETEGYRAACAKYGDNLDYGKDSIID